MLLSVDDHRIVSMDELKSVLYDREVGETVKVVIYRSGQQYRLELTLGENKGS
jgi:PDZ domain-containing secreted protein